MAAAAAAAPTPPANRIDVFWHEGMLNHDAGTGVFHTADDPGFLDVLEKHPENAERIKNMVSILQRGPIAPHISWHRGRPARVDELLSFHTADHVDQLIKADKEGGRQTICVGTFLNPGSWEAALLAAGTTLAAMEHILDGIGKVAYALVRPPGHHALMTQAYAYCFLNNAAIAVLMALESGIQRIAVIDIDVHHGNGTADGFYWSNQVLTISLHMDNGSWGPSHSQQKGCVEEVGEDDGRGYNMNIPLPNGTGDKGYLLAMCELVKPAVEKFEPDILVFVIGQDSSAFDPNGRLCLTMDGYRAIGQIVRGLADAHCRGRLLIVQEGGYHITYSAYCLHATLEGVLDLPEPLLADPFAHYPEDETFAMDVVSSIKEYQTDAILPFLKRDQLEGNLLGSGAKCFGPHQ